MFVTTTHPSNNITEAKKKLIGNVVLPQIPKHSPIQMRGSNEGLGL
jgi:hypothetical protein